MGKARLAPRKAYLIDTNAIIDYLGNELLEPASEQISEIINTEFNISVITEIEVLGHPSANENIIDFISMSYSIQLSEKIIQKTIDIRKSYKIKLPDAIIAATAISNELILVTRNVSELLNPHEI
ncbi:MAG: type II toxin-antitoxin system VapC family toxin [Sphingobacteriaceae bacterium]|nr:MAG: type II toxin-antitoxin system VapC family toxin [Sphingobacteriaceae bacterium]